MSDHLTPSFEALTQLPAPTAGELADRIETIRLTINGASPDEGQVMLAVLATAVEDYHVITGRRYGS